MEGGAGTMLDRMRHLLSQDVLANISFLKMIDTYGEDVQFKLVERDGEWAAWLLLPTWHSSYDSAVYPKVEFVVYMGCSGDFRLLQEVVSDIPRGKRCVFKVQKCEYRAVLETVFRLQKVREFISYTSGSDSVMSYSPDVVEGACLEELLFSLWSMNGYSRHEIQGYFEQGARAYSILESGILVSTCLVFQNYSRIWEVGAVYTVEQYRGKGYAKKVVESAISRLMSRGLIPRYQVVDGNIESIRLAESIGLRKFVVLEHLMMEDNLIC
jgi:RimJ/RimL family protein N-acetyltransferase